MKRLLIILTLLPHLLALSAADRSRLAPTPPMGWMSWNMFQDKISEQLIREVADAMVEQGFLAAGYEYIFIDDCWQGGRDARNNIIPDPGKFPNGMKALADYVHSKGLKLGIYSDAAQLTCAGYTASYGFEEQDARTFAEWGIDYLKYDYCNAPADSAEAHRRYRAMADALDRCGRDIVLGICEWGSHYPHCWAAQAGGSLFRTSGDVRDMWKDTVGQGGKGIMDILQVTAPIAGHAGKGCWPDMDMLIVGIRGKGGPSSDLGGVGCTDDEYQTQMSLWAMFASPLAMSHDVRHTDAASRSILLNRDIIAINQDRLGVPARRVADGGDGVQTFLRPLADGGYAVAVLNASDQPMRYSLSLAAIGLDGAFSVRDAWLGKDVARKARQLRGMLKSHETKVFVLRR